MKNVSLLLFCMIFSLYGESKETFWDTYAAALRGDKIAQFQTGVIYERGIGVEANQTQAALWYLKSAEQGYLDAQYNVAIMYIGGRGIEENSTAGMMWLSLAAKGGDKEARKLLLDVIDGKYDKVKKEQSTPIKIVEITPIVGIRLKTNRDTKICTPEGQCVGIKANTTVTSRAKSGSLYKVSGIGGKNGWEPYVGEGWIEESDVRRD
jgi:hypothetical protein